MIRPTRRGTTRADLPPDEAPRPGPPANGPPASWLSRDRWRLALLALATYVPLVLTEPGRVAADTKTYLYLDPGRLLSRAPSMWDPSIGLGTVTHQNIGYLWPMGPWFWAFELVGSPDWLAQRLWLATIMFAAGAGVVFLTRTLGWGSSGVLAAAAVYTFSPYMLHYGARISVILLPWAALPWLVALTQRSLQRGGWRDPALFALVVATVGGVNATALVLAGLGPLLWLAASVVVHREVSTGEALRAAARIGVLSVACSLWWMAGLAVQGGYGIDILRYTETVETVARTALASEVLRGLGYWFFYGGDLLGPWIEPGRSYTQQLWLIAVGFAVPILAFLAATSLRWRYRAFAVAMVLVGTVVAVGAHPYDDPSPLGGLFKELATSSSVGLALRSTPRAVPLVALGLALLIGAGVAAISARSTRQARAATLGAVVIAVAGLPPLWTGEVIGENLQRPEDIPAYWREAADHLEARGSDTRVLVVPGADFASYRWGNTVDPVLPGLMDRPMAGRELIPYGSPPSADLLMALDRRFQEGILDPAAIAPVARRLRAGEVVVQADLQFERYRTPRPATVAAALTPTPAGLGDPVPFGPPEPNEADRTIPLVDETTLATPPDTPVPAPVTAFPVDDPRPIVGVEPVAAPLLLAGDGEGIVDAAGAGLLDDAGMILSDADLVGDPALRRRVLDEGAHLLLTDSNRRRARRWNSVRENLGFTEQAAEAALDDTVADQRLPVFPGAGDDARTVVEQRGVAGVRASSYGNAVTYNSEDRAANAFDGDETTAWRAGAFGRIVDERLVVELDDEVVADELALTQPLTGPRNRWITEVEVVADGDPVGTFELGEASRRPGGEALRFDQISFTTLEIRVTGDNVGGVELDGLSSAGFAEVAVAGVAVDELVRLPRTLLAEAGQAASDNDLTVLVTRARADPRDPFRSDEEVAMARVFDLPAPRSFRLSGAARLAPRAADEVVDLALGSTGPVARSSGRVTGGVETRAAAAFDGDTATAWRPPFGDQIGRWVELEAAEPLEVSRLDLRLVTDGRASVPTRLRIEGDGQVIDTVDLEPVADLGQVGATTRLEVDVADFTATTVRIVIEDVRVVSASDSFTDTPLTLPVGIAEVGLGTEVAGAPDEVDTGCRDDLLTVDGTPTPVRVRGALGVGPGAPPLDLTGCGGSLDLGPGEHVVRAVDGRTTGIDIDQLVLRADGGVAAGPSRTAPPTVTVEGEGRTSFELSVAGADGPFWLVLGQSHNQGWQARAAGLGDLGPPRLVEGFANGWLVDPGERATLAISLDWTPQRLVWGGLALSALAVALCLALVVGGERRRPTRPWLGQGPLVPHLVVPWRGVGQTPPPASIAVTSIALFSLGAVVVDPLVGVVVGAVTLAALVHRPARAALTGGAVGLLGLSAAYVVARQFFAGHPPDFGWPSNFEPAHTLAAVAVVLLAADVVVSWLRRRITLDS